MAFKVSRINSGFAMPVNQQRRRLHGGGFKTAGAVDEEGTERRRRIANWGAEGQMSSFVTGRVRVGGVGQRKNW